MDREASDSKGYIFEIIKAVIIAVIISLLLILLLALLIKVLSIPTSTIPIINQVIKGASVLIACLISLKRPFNGWIRGIVVGIIYVAVAFLVFSLLDGGFSFDIGILNDLAIGSITGMISGIASSNLRK